MKKTLDNDKYLGLSMICDKCMGLLWLLVTDIIMTTKDYLGLLCISKEVICLQVEPCYDRHLKII